MTAADLRKLCTLLNNTSPHDLVRAAYLKPSVHYLEEKATILSKDPIRWMSSLDSVSLGRLAKLATETKL